MRLTDAQREVLERALDTLSQRVPSPTAAECRLLRHATSIVRDLPPGVRRVRADHETRRRTAQSEIQIP